MMDYIVLGSSPWDEECVQVSSNKIYLPEMTAECRRYLCYIGRLFPIPVNVNARFVIKSFPHDFGTYKEVCIIYDMDDEASTDFAIRVENNIPAKWGDA